MYSFTGKKGETPEELTLRTFTALALCGGLTIATQAAHAQTIDRYAVSVAAEQTCQRFMLSGGPNMLKYEALGFSIDRFCHCVGRTLALSMTQAEYVAELTRAHPNQQKYERVYTYCALYGH